MAGKIAMMDRGTAASRSRRKNAQLNGAIGVIIANHAAGGNGFINMGGRRTPTITIPSLSVGERQRQS